MIHIEDNPTCQHQEFLEDDEDFPSGPICEKPAKWLSCNPIGNPVCDDHKCRCKNPIRTKLESVQLRIDKAKSRFLLAVNELEEAFKEMNEIIKK